MRLTPMLSKEEVMILSKAQKAKAKRVARFLEKEEAELREETILKKQQITKDPRAKRNCILCNEYIDYSDYSLMGNFCQLCTRTCAELQKYRIDKGEQPAYYLSASENFQKECLKKRLVFEKRM